MERLPVVNECYQKWWDLQCRVNDFYSEKERYRPPLSQQKESRAIKNAVIQEAEHIRQNQIFFDDKGMEDGGGWVDDREFTWACWELRESMENEELSLAERDADVAEMVQLAKEATHTRNIFWDCYTGTAACSSRTRRRPHTG